VALKQAQAGVAVHVIRQGAGDGGEAALQVDCPLAAGQ
jgi:hypothetical protein